LLIFLFLFLFRSVQKTSKKTPANAAHKVRLGPADVNPLAGEDVLPQSRRER
jgi:hypothetical protein